MYVDTRSYRPSYAAPAKPIPRKLNGDERAAIAKAYYAGCTPAELAAQYCITPSRVAQISFGYDPVRYRARRYGPAEQIIAQPPSIETPEPVTVEPSPYHVVNMNGMSISLPKISIQQKGDAA